MEQQLTAAGNAAVRGLAQRYGVSQDAVATLLRAVANGNGMMAQFYHPELGGGGQWMQGGMTMVGDMFNGRLQSTVSGLCSELSALLGGEPLFAAPAPTPGHSQRGSSQQQWSAHSWWPAELGSPSSTGSQNESRYAYFPGARRLAISRAGSVTIHDTLDHQIGGVQQQQGGAGGSLSFTSQRGTFTVDSLPVVSPVPAARPAEVPVPPQHVPHVPQPASDERVVPSAQWTPPVTAPREPGTPPVTVPREPASTPTASAPSSEAATPSGASLPGPTSGAATRSGAGGSGPSSGSAPTSSRDVLDALERLGALRERGILTEEEFKAKKAELLARL